MTIRQKPRDKAMGGDLGVTGEDGPPKNVRWGTAYASVPPIFREVVLSDAR